MKRFALAVYAGLAYLLFLATIGYAVAFVLDAPVPKTIDSGAPQPWWPAAAVDALLLAAFAVQHSVMARPAFKRAWTRLVPEPAERSTYVLASNLALLLLFWQWRPLAGTVWTVTGAPAACLVALSLAGWGFAVAATWMIHHFDLFGVRQALLFLRGRRYSPVPFTVRGAYAVVRQPMMIGMVVGFWATPRLTAGHALFAAAATAYIAAGTWLEERDLGGALGDEYAAYRRRVGKFAPRLGRLALVSRRSPSATR